ncbi:perilipin 6 [Nothobranchius furzeri]|uniref:Perilipin 6 n=2 Tax=Nothobranchius furzeri TaxID=105023 RepID=A0A8C6LK32_NOTFU|nr:perilipin 6 [Nothobranchius furzeri]KAF7226485.1 perilipin-3-like [Nothobranchius furzeri]
MDTHPDQKTNVLLKISHLPLVQSALHSVTSAYSVVKDRFPLLGLMGAAAEVGVRGLSEEALRRAAPFLQNLEPQIEVANSLALDGLDHLERSFPILNQSTEEVMTHLKDAFFLTLDDVQIRVVEGLDGVVDQLEHLAEMVWTSVQQLQNTQVGQAASYGLDNALSRLEDATAYYLPLPPTLRREWEMRVQEYEEEDDDDEEPSLWTRVRSLLLTLSLQLYHRMSKVRGHLEGAVRSLGVAADRVGLSWILELTGELLQNLQNLLVALLFRAESIRETTLWEIKDRASTLAELIPVRQVGELPDQIQQVLRDLQELSKILLQLVVNTTPLYSMLELPSPQELEDFLNQEDFVLDGSSRRSSTNSLFLKAMDGRPRRRRSLYARANRGSGPQSPEPPNDRRSSMKESSNPDVEGMAPSSEGNTFRRPSATELLLTPLKQFVSQSQKAFEYLSPNSTGNDAIVAATDDF